jgi:hypothetical protein
LFDLGHDRVEENAEVDPLASINSFLDHPAGEYDYGRVGVLERQHALPLPLDCDPPQGRPVGKHLTEHRTHACELVVLRGLQCSIILQLLEQLQVVFVACKFHVPVPRPQHRQDSRDLSGNPFTVSLCHRSDRLFDVLSPTPIN